MTKEVTESTENLSAKKKLFEVVFNKNHEESPIIEDVEFRLKETKQIVDFAYILHDKDRYSDDTLKEPHYHIVIRADNAYTFKTVANWLDVKPQFVNKINSRWGHALLYLTHRNAPSKYQYSDDEVVSNYDWIEDRNNFQRGNVTKKRELDIMDMIVNGQIKEYNISEMLRPIEFIKCKRTIDEAFKYRTQKMKRVKRNMECIYITGKSGTGKSTYAQMLCEAKGLSCFVSSGSNDILDGYGGEEVILLDDMRSDYIGVSDLLKLLDNNTASTVKSRYKNKVIECKMIIITSVHSIEEFFKKALKGENEPIKQLHRRCKTHIRVEEECIYVSVYDEALESYLPEKRFENPVFKKYPKVPLTVEEEEKRIEQVLF